MPTLTIKHITTYQYRQPVSFGEHRMMLRPRDGHDQSVINAKPVNGTQAFCGRCPKSFYSVVRLG
jgi:hypothetical protein